MRSLTILALLISFSFPAISQSDVCTPMNKALIGVAANFDSYTNYQFQTKGGQGAYLSDFSFVAGATTYIYKDNVKKENYIFQKLTDDGSTYTAWYKSIEQCLLQQKEKAESATSDQPIGNKNGQRVPHIWAERFRESRRPHR